MATRPVEAVALGQLLAALIAGSAVASAFLASRGISLPMLQSSAVYVLLAAVYGGSLLRRRPRPALHHNWRAYALLAALDVEANFCVVLAFRWTNITSVTLLDSFSIPVAVALSALVLGARYRSHHYAGAAVCVAGLLVLLLGDRGGGGASGTGGTSGASAGPVLGDCLVLLGASLYAAANVAQERLLGGAPPGEVLAMLGLLGSVLALAQGLPLELGRALAAPWSPAAAAAAAGYTAALLAFYSLVPRLLVLGGAALLNLSLLSSDVWAAGARALFFGGFSRLSGLCFLLAFALVALGLALFSRGGEVAAAAQEQRQQQPEAAKRQQYRAVPSAVAGPALEGPERSIELEPEEGGSLRGSPMHAAALPSAAPLGGGMVHYHHQQRHASDSPAL